VNQAFRPGEFEAYVGHMSCLSLSYFNSCEKYISYLEIIAQYWFFKLGSGESMLANHN